MIMPNLLKDYKYPEVVELVKKNALVLIPCGILEEHADHLPISTDCDIVENIVLAISDKIVNNIPHVVTPTVWTGYSPNFLMDRFPVFVSIKLNTFIQLLEDLVESFIRMGIKKIIIINGHGGNSAALPIVGRTIQDNHRIFIASFNLFSMCDNASEIRKSKIGGICHAGEFETSLELYFGNTVDMSKASNKDRMTYKSKFVCGDPFGTGNRVNWSTWAYNKTNTGALGDSSVATKETGERVFNNIVKNSVDFIEEFYSYKG
jgi:creatinine amidohydrolase